MLRAPELGRRGLQTAVGERSVVGLVTLCATHLVCGATIWLLLLLLLLSVVRIVRSVVRHGCSRRRWRHAQRRGAVACSAAPTPATTTAPRN